MLLGHFQSSVLMNKVCTQYRLLSNCSENDEVCMYKLIFEHGGKVASKRNVYEVNPWLWQFGRGKPRLGSLTVEETADRQLAKVVDRKKRAVETRRRRKADRA
jgi:hypothetical protein